MKQIVPGLYTFENLIVGRAYLIVDPDGLTVIDASIPPSTGAILRQISASGHKVTDVKRILLTHAHPDHVGGLAELRRQSGGELITSEVEKQYAQGEARVPVGKGRIKAPSTLNKGITVDRTVREGDVIAAFGGLQVVATPGHAPGHVSFWQPERKVLFTGDAMMYLLGGLRLPLAMATPDMPEAKRSIQRLAELPVEIACFGHGTPMTGNTAAKIRAFAARAAHD